MRISPTPSRASSLVEDSHPGLSYKGAEMVYKLQRPQPYAFHGTFYDKDKNPNGTISLWYSENSLMSTELLEFFNSHFHMTHDDLKYRWRFIYSSQPSTLQALPEYYNAYFKPVVPVTPENSVQGSGVSLLFASFIDAVCDPGDEVLMTAPSYGYFSYLIEYPAQAKIVATHVPASVDPLSVDAIKYLRAALDNPSNRIRVLLLCNPHNPIGAAYPEETIIEYAKLAEEYNIHLLADEVFALQVYSSKYVPCPTPFTSILAIDLASHGVDPSRIHIIAGPSKAFGAGGLKLGTFISQHNPDLIQFMDHIADINQMCTTTDLLFTAVLSDVKYRDWFLEENRRRLRAAFEFAADWCVFHRLPFLPSSAGVFFMVDLASVVRHVIWDKPKPHDKFVAVFNAMMRLGVYAQPVESADDPKAIWFRIMFAMPSDTMLVALRRIEKAFGMARWEPSCDRFSFHWSG